MSASDRPNQLGRPLAIQGTTAGETIRIVLETAPQGMLILGQSGRVLDQNRHVADLVGSTRPVGDLTALFPLEDRARIKARMLLAAGEDPGTRSMTDAMETAIQRADGTMVPVDLVITPFWAGKEAYISASLTNVTYRKRLERELQARNDDLEQFTSLASHDLQEPLRMVVNYCELIERHAEDKLDAKSKLYVRYASDGARRLQLLVDGLLEYAHLGKTALAPRPTKLDELMDSIIADLQPMITRTSTQVTLGDLKTTMVVDPVLMRQVFQNLLTNSMKFHGPRPPHITITCENTDTLLRIRVDDQGIGITPGQEERIFRMFQRLHTRAEYAGNGIGLAFARKIVESHEGTITAANLPEGGARFTITLRKYLS